jgi:RNA polymerase sigma factor (sigma-70 family)
MDSSDPILTDLLAHEAWVKALARRLVADTDDADDLAQDALMAALEHPPRGLRRLRSWLGGVVRNLAARRRRDRAARRRGEAAAAATDRLPSVLEMHERAEMSIRIARAVFALEEPYRSAVLYRFFEDLPPREIAERLDVTVAAVETRLRRGLEKLRARLTRDFGARDKWRAALLPLTGAGVAPSATGASSMATESTSVGALLMSTKIKVGLGVAAIVIAAGTLAVWPGKDDPTPPESVARAPAPVRPKTPESNVAAAAGETPGGSVDVPTRDRVPAAPPPVAKTAEATTLEGRCVDAITGEPLAGCAVTLMGEPGDSVEAENHIVRHGVIRWNPPEPRITGADGRFAFAITPAAPLRFTLRLTRSGRVPMMATWPRLEPGRIVNLGDVPMRGGVLPSVRVVDPQGIPQAGVQVNLWRWPPAKGEGAFPSSPVCFETEADGTGHCPHAIPPGTWKVSLTDRWLEGPQEIHLAEHGADRPYQVVVAAARPITGVVLDPMGQPVAEATVMVCPADSLSGHRVRTRADGSFRLGASAKHESGPVALSVVKDGFDLLWGHGSYPWGSEGVRLVIRRGLPVEIRVRDARTGAPIEEFGVRCFLEKPPGDHLPDDPQRLKLPGRHAGGVLTVPAVRRGTNVLMVEPLGNCEYAPSPWIRATVGESGPASVEIRLQPNAKRRLLVVDARGRVVAGTEIELLRPPEGEPVRIASRAGAPSLLRYNKREELCIVLQYGATDERGELMLSGPGNEPLAVRVLGPGHPPQVVNDVVLDPALGPLRVETAASGRLRGVLRPPAALVKLGPGPIPWKHVARSGEVSRDRSADAARRPTVRLVPDPSLPTTKDRPRSLVAPVGEDGAFCFSGVPAGTWNVHLDYSMPLDGRGGGTHHTRLLGTVSGLREGEERELVFDVSDVFPGRLAGTVFLNGQPLATEPVSFASVARDRAGRPRLVPANRSVSTDSRGAFAIDLEPGLYRLRLENRGSDERGAAIISNDAIEISPGSAIQRDFHLVCATLELRVLGADGKTPVKGVRLYSEIPSQRWRFYTRRTDSEGRIVINRVPPGAIRFMVWPRTIRTAEDENRFMREHRADWRAKLPCLGTIEIPGSAARVVKELVMPPESGY